MNFARLTLQLSAGAALVLSVGVQAQSYKRDNFRDIRWLGRGNTGIATIKDGTALFYNPAGVAQPDYYSFSVFNPAVGANENIYFTGTQLSTIMSSDEALTTKLAPFLGTPLGVSGSIFPHLAVPGFSGGFWDYFDVGLQYRNPVSPELYIDSRNDYGIILGSGFGYKDYVNFGFSFRYHRRKLVSEAITGARAVTLAQGATGADLLELVKKGEGWGINLGVQTKVDVGKASWVGLGATAEDVGYTKFKSSTGNAPIPQAMQINFGSAAGLKTGFIDVTVLADYRQWNNADLHPSKKIFMGFEASMLTMDLRAGLFQGYWTAGLSLRALPLFDIDFATYGEEVGYAAGIKQNRLWMLGLRTGIGLQQKSRGKGGSGKRYRSQLDAL